jgi:hypothetical protein
MASLGSSAGAGAATGTSGRAERRKQPRNRSSKNARKGSKRAASAKSPKAARGSGGGGADDITVSAYGALQPTGVVGEEFCRNCSKSLEKEDRALFVEEEIGRVFCTEKCISAYFTPEIERLEKEYYRRLSANDLSKEDRENLAHLRWVTLQEPDEVWREKTLSGDFRYTLISEFQPGTRKVWCICLCLFLRGEPSFLYLSFATKNTAMANHYRRGERVQWVKGEAEARRAKTEADGIEIVPASGLAEQGSGASSEQGSDRLAAPWTEDEMFRAQAIQERRDDDIPPEEFSLYQSCLEETLETPDEVWTYISSSKGKDPFAMYHFIRHYPDEDPGVWYVIIARETDDEEQIEILDAFPTRDAELVHRYRKGEQEVGSSSAGPVSRVVH